MLWPCEVGVKIGELQQRHDVENQLHDVAENAEIERPDVAMFGVGFGSIFSP